MDVSPLEKFYVTNGHTNIYSAGSRNRIFEGIEKMFLDTTTRKLQVVLTAAMTTSNMPVVVDWVDMTTTSTTAGVTPSNTNGVTAVDILPAPAASTQRKVNGITIYNKDTAAKTVQILFNDNATTYQILDITLQVDDVLGYTDTKGWYTLDVNGNTKTVATTTATSIASSIHGAPNKTTPVDADETGIWDSVTSALNKVTWANIKATLGSTFAALAGSGTQVFSVAAPTSASHATQLQQVSLYPTVASAATIDIFGAAGATLNVSGTVTVTGITACTAAQVGSIKTIIPSNASGFSITASANIVVDGATSGTYLMPQNANIQIIATSTTTFNITTIFASGSWTPTSVSLGGSSIAYDARWRKVGNIISIDIYITGSGLSSTANTTSLTLPPFTPVMPSSVSGITGAVAQGGIGLIWTDGKLYPPTITSTNNGYALSGYYLI